MKYRIISFTWLILIVLMFSASLYAQDSELPTLADLEIGWNTLLPGSDTMCSQGTDYEFYVHPAESDNLLVYFNGGGACWNWQLCNLQAEPVPYVPFVEIESNDPSIATGIFNLDNNENPFRDYSIVFIPYCTGDVHIGSGERIYKFEDKNNRYETTIYHNGYDNSMAVLNWVFANYETPEKIVVMGSSAGAIASPLYAGILAEHYPDSSIIQLGDGAGGYRSDLLHLVFTAWNTTDILPDWEAFANETPETLTFEDLYIAVANEFPNIQIAQYNTAGDKTQSGFLELLGETDFSLPNFLLANYADIYENDADFLTYSAGGTLHTILHRPEFYTYEVAGVRFVDWVRGYINGDDVESISCQMDNSCTVAPDAKTGR